MTPEQKARAEIDSELAAAGWLVQDVGDLDLAAGRGIAVREFPMRSGFGFADYLLYVDRKAAGAVKETQALRNIVQGCVQPQISLTKALIGKCSDELFDDAEHPVSVADRLPPCLIRIKLSNRLKL